ncbi:MAG: hypothetical protein HUJ55_07610, partial [Ileibacterium sp.]|nr:hypothetical protein [Ileibacterium sp.]
MKCDFTSPLSCPFFFLYGPGKKNLAQSLIIEVFKVLVEFFQCDIVLIKALSVHQDKISTNRKQGIGMPGIRVRIYRSTYTFQLMNYREYTELERDMELVECVRAQPWITLLSLGCGDAPSISGREYAFLKTLASLFIKRVREGNVQRDISETDLQQIENSFTAWEKSCFYFDLKESSSSLWQQMYICFQTLKTRFSENTESIIKDLSLQLHAPGQVVFQLQESENCEYPFSLKIGYIAKRQGWKTIQPLEDLIKNPFGLCGELQRISGKMLSLAKKYPWLQEHLWQGTIGGELPLDPVESWKLVKEA